MKHDVFISYSSQNSDAAKAVCHILEENEVKCWMAPRDIPPGTEYGDMIDDAIKSSKIIVLLFSETAATSIWVKGELNIAFEEQKVIIPFRLDKTPLKGQHRVILNHKHWIDAYPDYQTKFQDLLNAVRLTLGLSTSYASTPKSTDKKVQKGKKLVFTAISAIVFIFATIFTLHFLNVRKNVYSYDKNGLHTKIKGLTAEQKTALTLILDNMKLIEGGSFIMGNDYSKADSFTLQDSLSRNPHEVTLSNFYISKYEITQKEWEAFMPLEGKCIEYGDNKPMDMLSWENANSFCEALTSITGLEFSLPTESQWEYAARGGNKSDRHIYSGHSYDVREIAWTIYDGLVSAHETGEENKRCNELGLFNMTGNVSEWCKDYYAEYEPAPACNPQGPDTGMFKILRGGDFRTPDINDLKTTTRYYASPFVNRKGSGMRLLININKRDND